MKMKRFEGKVKIYDLEKNEQDYASYDEDFLSDSLYQYLGDTNIGIEVKGKNGEINRTLICIEDYDYGNLITEVAKENFEDYEVLGSIAEFDDSVYIFQEGGVSHLVVNGEVVFIVDDGADDQEIFYSRELFEDYVYCATNIGDVDDTTDIREELKVLLGLKKQKRLE